MSMPSDNGQTSPNERVIRVFISSTFRDMHAERDHLVTVVFPELRERVEQLGLEFFDVDLRWGVPAKGANGETANSWEYCRQWIDRVEPFFVCILGQRYGWVPGVEDFKDEADRARQASEPRSITDLEVRHAVLDDRRKRRSYFYLRETSVPELPPDATADQRMIHDEFVDPPERRDQLDALKTEIRGCGRPVRGYECRWTGTAFAGLDRAEKKFGPMVLEDLWSGVLRDERYVSKAVWRQVLDEEPDADLRYTDESQPVPRELWQQIVALARPAPESPLDAERHQMDAFAASRLRWFQGRTRELQQLTDFLHSTAADAPRLAVVAAVPGQGKSALIAKLHQQLSELPQEGTKPSAPSDERWARSPLRADSAVSAETPSEERRARSLAPCLITHFVGATERSASAHALVERLIGELDRSGIAWPADEEKPGQEPKRDFNSLCLRLAQRLGDYVGERRIVILLDALNQLSDGHDLQWLPTRLGPGVRVIVSCIDDATLTRPVGHPLPSGRGAGGEGSAPEQRVLHALASRQPAPLRVLLGPLTEADVRTIVVAYLHEYCHELDSEHLDTLCAITQARNPLYLLVMLNELRTLGGNDLNRIVPSLIAAMPQEHPDTVSLFRWVLQRLHPAFGDEAVALWCSYLAVGRVGMSGSELSDLLASRLGPDGRTAARRIERSLRRYLQGRGSQVDFFHGQLRQAIRELYSLEDRAPERHREAAEYFRGLADPSGDYSWTGGGTRPFMELPFHLGHAGPGMREAWFTTVGQLGFAQAKSLAALVYPLVGDLDAALHEARGSVQWRRLSQLRQAVWTQASGLHQMPSLARQQLALRMFDYVDPDQQLVSDAQRCFHEHAAPGQGWAYPCLPAHRRGEAEQVDVSGVPHVRALALHGPNVLAFCEGRRWHELDALGVSVHEGTLSHEFHVAAGGGGRIAAAVGRFGFVWNEWPAQQPHARFTVADDVTLLACAAAREEILVGSREGSWTVLRRGPTGTWTSAGRSRSPAKIVAAAALDGSRWAVVTANGSVHLGSGTAWDEVVLPYGEVTAACLDAAGQRLASSHHGQITVFDFGGVAVRTFPSVAPGITQVRLLPDGSLLAATEAAEILLFPVGEKSHPTTLAAHGQQVADIVVFDDGRRAITFDYVGKAAILSTNLPALELAERELPATGTVRGLHADGAFRRIQGVDASGGRFALEGARDAWSAKSLESLPHRVAHAWFRDGETLVTSEDFNAASSLYEHRVGESAAIHTRRVWPAPGKLETFRSLSSASCSGGGGALAISIRRSERGGNEVLVFNTRDWHIVSRTEFEGGDDVDRVVVDDRGETVLLNHKRVDHLLTLVRRGTCHSLPLAGGVIRGELGGDRALGDLDLTADGTRFVTVQSDGTAFLVQTDQPKEENRVPLGVGVRWCRLSACGGYVLLGRGERDVEAIRLAPDARTQPLCRFLAPFRIEWAGIWPAHQAAIVAGNAAVWGVRFSWSPD